MTYWTRVKILILTMSLFALATSCNSLLYSKDIEKAKQMANGDEYNVTESSFDRRETGGPVVTGACDLSISFSKAASNAKEHFCIYKDHSAFSDYAALRSGDRVKFDFVENSMMSGGSGISFVSFLLVQRLYR